MKYSQIVEPFSDGFVLQNVYSEELIEQEISDETKQGALANIGSDISSKIKGKTTSIFNNTPIEEEQDSSEDESAVEEEKPKPKSNIKDIFLIVIISIILLLIISGTIFYFSFYIK